MTAPRSQAPPPAPPEALGEILDEHAELADLLGQLREAADVRELAGLLERLEELLGRHFAHEEEAGVLALLAGGPGGEGEAARLGDEHREILGCARELVRSIRTERASAASARAEAAALLERLCRHDARETALLHERAGVEAGAPADRARRPPSKALEVNLRRTAVSVVIPEEQRVLLELSANLHGIHESTKALLREINHRYVGWAETIEDLHRRATSDFGHYRAQPRAAEAVAVFCALYEKALAEAAPAALRETALRRYLQYLAKLAAEADERLADLRAPLGAALERLGALLARAPELTSPASTGLRRLAEALRAADPDGAPSARCLELLAETLRRVYAGWLARGDPEAWWRELRGAPGEAPPEAVAALSHARLAGHLARLDALRSAGPALQQADARLALPDAARIERGYLAAAAELDPPGGDGWESRLRRVRWLIRMLCEDALHAVHDDAIAEIHRACAHTLRDADAASAAPLVREIFTGLRRSGLASSPAALTLVTRLGQEALCAERPAWREAFVDELLDWDFAYPEFAGFTEEWQVRANPAHVGAIRAFLAVIEADPEAARPLVAALVVHLKLGGVVIADTDLFQRDVTRLLRSPVAPAWHPVKRLLKLFPVYFNEIGAEGELREVSSRIDEMTGRRDPLCHFLRKQAHVESNPELLGLIQAVGRFWATGDREPLRRWLPETLHAGLAIDDPRYAGLHRLFRELAGDAPPEALFALDEETLEKRLAAARAGDEADREKARLLFRLRALVGRKYEIRHDDVLERLAAFRRVPAAQQDALGAALAAGDHERALGLLLDVLETLQGIVLGEDAGEALEEIYRKRHVAAGIPSMYGSYREEKVEAVGLSLRVESLANALFDRLIAGASLDWMTRSTLRRVHGWLRLLRRALRVDGFRARGLSAGIAMLDEALRSGRACVEQYVNVFQVLSRGIEQLIRIRFLETYDEPLRRILPRMLERGVVRADGEGGPEAAELKLSEAFLRDLVAESFGLQQLDLLVGRALRSLVRARDTLERGTAALLVDYETERGIVEIDGEPGPLDGTLSLGNKGYMLERLAGYGLPVPPGFILTTEIFRHRPVLMACPELSQELDAGLRRQLARLERATGCRFGDPRRPLLLSVRSGAAISMPGVLDTFLNVGINAEIAEGFAARSGSAWGAWDAYRRFLQLWGMANGIDRELFHALISETKQRHGAAKKALLPPERMRELAFRYRDLVLGHGVPVEEDPFAQLRACADLVLRSWYGERARVYREAMQIAHAWGTAVVVQCMVYGNLNQRAGTGVVLTCDPAERADDVGLVGDFVVQGQGDDVVGGVVETFPIGAGERPAAMSLERDFPAIHAELRRWARLLIRDLELFHQEIEFTFESGDPKDLWVLQTRDSVMATISQVAAFVPSEALERAKVATGVGAGGGALSGRVAHRAEDVETLRREHPDDPIILLRPDTVPDDIPLVLRSDGMVTALGGATSHAALVALRLGRTCVVGCRQLEVYADESGSRIAGRPLATGDFISINGIDGSVYLGRHPTTTVRRQRLV